MSIKVDRLTNPFGSVYYKAYLPTHPNNYTVGDTRQEAIKYLRSAIKSRPDIYG